MPYNNSEVIMDSLRNPAQKPDSVIRSIDHYQQRSHWDCGISCVLMCLNKEARDGISRDISEVCREEEFGQSTWTIDLCYLIRHRSPLTLFHYTTTTIGVDPQYASEVQKRYVLHCYLEHFSMCIQIGFKEFKQVF